MSVMNAMAMVKQLSPTVTHSKACMKMENDTEMEHTGLFSWKLRYKAIIRYNKCF